MFYSVCSMNFPNSGLAETNETKHYIFVMFAKQQQKNWKKTSNFTWIQMFRKAYKSHTYNKSKKQNKSCKFKVLSAYCVYVSFSTHTMNNQTINENKNVNAIEERIFSTVMLRDLIKTFIVSSSSSSSTSI